MKNYITEKATNTEETLKDAYNRNHTEGALYFAGFIATYTLTHNFILTSLLCAACKGFSTLLQKAEPLSSGKEKAFNHAFASAPLIAALITGSATDTSNTKQDVQNDNTCHEVIENTVKQTKPTNLMIG